MSAEQRKILLFFWTSVKYLPVEGFGGLASRLYIYKSSEPSVRLPSSHTCFYRLSFPPYPSMAIMEDRLRIITQEHVGCSFGTWWAIYCISFWDKKGFWLHREICTSACTDYRIILSSSSSFSPFFLFFFF